MRPLETNTEFMDGVWGGMWAGLVMFIWVEPFSLLGWTKFDILYIASETVFEHQNNLIMNGIGFLIHLGVSAFWGVIISLLMHWVFNRRYLYVKVLVISVWMFFFHFGILDESFHYSREVHRRTLDMSIYLAGYVIYSLVFARYLKSRLKKVV